MLRLKVIFILIGLLTIPPSYAVVRFVALGDAGEGNFEQYQVGRTIQEICTQKGCNFALYLGDNFYDTGVSSVNDAQFSTKFELPYTNINMPFFVALGNHDHGNGLQFWKTWNQVSYTFSSNSSGKWQMPSTYHHHRIENVEIFVLDSQSIFLSTTAKAQKKWLDQKLAASTAQWKIVTAHHPYISNGRHGNAGNYEGCFFCTVIGGSHVQRFIEQSVCGKTDFYMSGHDHNLQWLNPACGTEFIVSGAGSKTTRFVHRDNNPVFFENDQTAGFMWVEIDGNQFTGVFYDLYGNELFRRVQTK